MDAIRTGTQVMARGNAYVTSAHDSSIRHDVPAGTIATAGQAYVTWVGTKVHDWSVQGLRGDAWQLRGAWVEVAYRTDVPHGLLTPGDETFLGVVEQVSLTAYRIGGEWFGFTKVHGPHAATEILVQFG